MAHSSHQKTHDDLQALARRYHALRYQFGEVTGCLAEYRAMPCRSLEDRMFQALDSAVSAVEGMEKDDA